MRLVEILSEEIYDEKRFWVTPDAKLVPTDQHGDSLRRLIKEYSPESTKDKRWYTGMWDDMWSLGAELGFVSVILEKSDVRGNKLFFRWSSWDDLLPKQQKVIALLGKKEESKIIVDPASSNNTGKYKRRSDKSA